jgi:uncharacterized protein YbgA (DUF1722 family)/uncharacterized protein YbbK (DUF523 family)
VSNVRPRLVVSKCIEFDHCRFDGAMINSDLVRRMKGRIDLIPVCPEMGMGLGVPRDPVRVVSMKNDERRLVAPNTGIDLTERSQRYCSMFLMGLDQIDGFLMKSRSPSCGLRDTPIYPTERCGTPRTKGAGFLGEAILGMFKEAAVEDDLRLKDPGIAEHFLTKLYALARFRELPRDVDSLMQFQAENKFLLMMYGQNKARMMGNVAANRDKRDVGDVFNQYRSELCSLLENRPVTGAAANVMMHALGYHKKSLANDEKKAFLAVLDDYRTNNTPIAGCLDILRSFNLRFPNEYLSRQTFFEPFPADLLPERQAGNKDPRPDSEPPAA